MGVYSVLGVRQLYSDRVAQRLAWLVADAQKDLARWQHAEHIVVKRYGLGSGWSQPRVLVSADVDMGGIARYLEAEDDVRESYWDDVKLQMVCKMWAQEYNKCHPPKQVCCAR